MMSPETEKQCDEQLVAITGLYRAKQIDDNVYYKCLVALAYEFAVGEKYVRAATLTQGIPVEYYQQVQRKQMEEDANFAYICYTLALALLQQGFVHIGPQVTPTMPVASA